MLLKTKVNRATPKWTRREQFLRGLWSLMHPLFRYSPRIFWSWRVFILRLFGASIGSDVHIHPTAMIALPWNLVIGAEASIGDRAILYNLGRISIGDGATVSQGAHLCAGTHDTGEPTCRCLNYRSPLVKVRGSVRTVLSDRE